MYMIFPIPVVSTLEADNSPKLSAVKDGKQTIEIYDSKLGGMRKITTTPDKVDEFIKNGNEEDSNIAQKARKNLLKSGSVGAVLGAAATLLSQSIRGSVVGTILCAAIGAMLGTIPFLCKYSHARNKAVDTRIQNFIENNK